MTRFQALLLDVGGTMYVNPQFDAEFGRALEEHLSELLNVDRSQASAMLAERMRELEQLEGDPSKVRAMSTFGVDRDNVHEVFSTVDPYAYLTPEPETRETLELLIGHGIRLAVLSNFRRSLVDRILEAIGVDQAMFEFLLTEDEGLPIKPSRVPFRVASERFELDPNKIGYVGDSHSKDIVPASDVGYTTIWINRSNKKGDAAAFEIRSFREITALAVSD